MSFCTNQIKIKFETGCAFAPYYLEISDGFLAFQKRSMLGIAVGGLVGYAISETARAKKDVTLIPLDQIASVETKSTFATAFVIVRPINHPAFTIACSSKKEMNRIAELLKA